ncbi:MAG: site-2 protease family protein [Candidatus Pacebacteria bacterium]|jgi:Zn-dependent protease|nr:site-2 protease family protein [Candidatus Paceibacterota bacterium]
MGIAEIAIIIALILSIVLHEVAHGYAANWLGDPTARLAGRLTANPIPHIDPLGSVIIPALLFFSSAGFLFGWAKPVPYNPYNLRNQRWGEAFVAAAGPLVNILLAVIFAGIIRMSDVLNLSASFVELAVYVVTINILLACFNLIPIPPLDGSKILLSVLPYTWGVKYRALGSVISRYGILMTFLLIFLFISVFWSPFITFVHTLTGVLIGA